MAEVHLPVQQKNVYIHEAWKLRNETGNVAFDAATLEVLGLEEQQRNM